MEPGTAWSWKRFEELTPHELYAMIALRERVFVVEQQSIYLDCDGIDPACEHLLARRGDAIVGTLRIVPPGLRYPEPSIGRVVVDRAERGSGLGREMMRRGIERAGERFPGRPILLSAQCYLERFYASFGFRSEGEPYDEDGIPHIRMVRPPTT